MSLNLPRFIALCGYAGAGKSEVQKILRADFDVLPVDDGWPLRDYAIRHMGANAARSPTECSGGAQPMIADARLLTLRIFQVSRAAFGRNALPACSNRSTTPSNA